MTDVNNDGVYEPCSVTVSWDARHAPGAVARTLLENGTLGAWQSVKSVEPGVTIPWITQQKRRFVVYESTAAHASMLADTGWVYGIPQLPVAGQVSASPHTCIIEPLESSCQSLITWTSSGASVQLRRIQGGTSQLVSQAPNGSVTAAGITQAGVEYRLISGSNVLDSEIVNARALAMGPYEVGVDYHAYTPTYPTGIFLPRYHEAGVRGAVQGQLAAMKNEGVSAVHTRIFIAGPVAPEALEFPPTEQERQNVAHYIQDVADAGLALDITFLWLGQAKVTVGRLDCMEAACPKGAGVGANNLPVPEFSSRVEQTFEVLVPEFARGTVRTVYFDGEALYEPIPSNQARINENWFVSSHYPEFVDQVLNAGREPSIYFLQAASDERALDNSWIDPNYPILNNRRSMYWPYRSLLFLQNNGLYIPERFDFSLYPDAASSQGDWDPQLASDIVERVFEDADAVLGGFGITSYGVSESFYFADPGHFKELCKMFALQASELNGMRVKNLFVWTTPYKELRENLGAQEVAVPPNMSRCIP